MKNIMLMAGAMLVLTSAAFAWPDHDKKPVAKGGKTEVHCAVMIKDPVNIKKATADKMFADYKGRRYFFCCAGCPAAFKANPAKYAKNESIPTPKAAPKPKKSRS
jgi:YHS domain-containing protein